MGYYMTLLGNKLELREGIETIDSFETESFIIDYDIEVDGAKYYRVSTFGDLKWTGELDDELKQIAQRFNGYITTIAEDGTPYKFVFKDGKVYVGEGEIVFPDDTFIVETAEL